MTATRREGRMTVFAETNLDGTGAGMALAGASGVIALVWMFMEKLNSWKSSAAKIRADALRARIDAESAEDERQAARRKRRIDDEMRVAPILTDRVRYLEEKLEKVHESDTECWEEHARKDEVNKWQQRQIDEQKRSITELVGLLKKHHPDISDTAVHRIIPAEIPPPPAVLDPTPLPGKPGSSGRLRTPTGPPTDLPPGTVLPSEPDHETPPEDRGKPKTTDLHFTDDA